MNPRHSKLKWTLGFTLVVASSLGGVAPAQAAPVNPAAVAQLQTVPAATTVSLSSSDFFRPNFQNGVLNNGIDPYSRSTEEQIRRAKEQIPNALFKKDKNGKRTDMVDLVKFDRKVGDNKFKGPKGWTKSKDMASHKGEAWKLFNRKGERVATVDRDGRIVGK